jgi:nitroimidazol reductase NimA-like FMN-containing flavoprotein (pyridoxamine 5'-phosphate oxidase superfamily)
MNGDPQVEALTRSECLGYLAAARFGRLGLTMRALPVIVPVRFALTPDQVVFRAPSESTLRNAADGSVVVFQADHDGDDTGIGWTVQAHGRCQEIVDPFEMNQLFDLPLRPWNTSPPGDSFMAIPLGQVRGERVYW